MKIEDSTGSGKGAKVNKDNQLEVKSTAQPVISHTSQVENKAFQVHSERALVAAATFENILSFEYTGTGTLFIENIVFSREDVALVPTTGQAVFEMMLDSTYTSGGTSVPPINLNMSSGVISDVTAYSGVTTITLGTTSQLELMDFAVQNTHTHNFQGALIMKKGNHLSVLGKSKVIGDTLHCVVFYREEA